MLKFNIPISTSLGRCRHFHSSILNYANEGSTSVATNTAKWTPTSIRTGVIARKRGMISLWDEHGAHFPVTVLQLDNCQVTANIKTVRNDSSIYHAVQVAASDRPPKTTTRAMRGHFARAGVVPKRIVREFPVTEDAHVPIGTTLTASHFVPGQYVDVVANSIGKGYAGTMKRWNFHGQSKSHGTSVSHRSSGSIGQHQDPGRVWPGQKMAGRLGNERTTQHNLYVARIDNNLNLMFVRGCVPGVDNAHVLVRDAKKKMVQTAQQNDSRGLSEKVLPKGVLDLPFPAGTKALAEKLPSIIAAPSNRRSPFLPYS